MTISRRDIIFVAVLVNLGLLAVLFMTAVRYDDEGVLNSNITQEIVSVDKETMPMQEIQIANETTPVPPINPLGSPLPTPKDEDFAAIPVTETQVTEKTLEQNSAKNTITSNKSYVEVTVKKGDFLEKIAKNNNSSIEEIKKVNNLPNDRLNVGQVLRVPQNVSKTNTVAKSNKIENEEAVYYVIKNGDNPWKVARQFGVRYEDILKLNSLNEEKARNLKIGDTIRVK